MTTNQKLDSLLVDINALEAQKLELLKAVVANPTDATLKQLLDDTRQLIKARWVDYETLEATIC